MNNVRESLKGRIGNLDLYGLSTRELYQLQENIFLPDINLLKKKEKITTLSTKKVFERIITGSYPEVIKLNNTNREKFYEAYIRSYLERDVRQLINIKDENKFIKFISSVAVRTGQEYKPILQET